MSSYELHRVVAGGRDADGLKSLEKLAFEEPSSSAVISDASLKCMIVRPRDPRRPLKIAMSTAGLTWNLTDGSSRMTSTNDIADRAVPDSVPKDRNIRLAASRYACGGL
ncbi:unnamed protein product [Phytophthora fragariaefolia]|uniref:Unnamed protein product n=1 Tax=Phytophthora fragariaefolia TaxID=1490495 RepID=A0A9W6XJL1_9STRA|nr:unnamed protein product [Phytophthora fragariaefolia]